MLAGPTAEIGVPVPSDVILQIEHEIAGGLGAADQGTAVSGLVDRIGGVADRARHQARLAGVAHAGATGPAHGDVAGLGQLQQAAVAGTPADGQPAACEGDLGPSPDSPAGGCGGRLGDSAIPGVTDGPAPKISVRIRAWSSPSAVERVRDLGHERGRPADVGVGIDRQVQRLEPRRRQPSVRLVVASLDVVRTRTAVADVPVSVWQRGKQGLRLGGEWLLGPAARAVQPPDLAARACGGQRVQHGQDRSGADTGADQQDRCRPGPEDERAAWRGDLQQCRPARTCSCMNRLAAPCSSRLTLTR